MTTKLEYLKRYMEPEEPKKKVKLRKRIRSIKSTNVKILDTNIDLNDIKRGSDSEASENAGLLGEDEPQVAAVIDERPLEMRSFSNTFKASSVKDVDQSASSFRRRRDFGSSDTSPVRRRERKDSSSDECPQRESSVNRNKEEYQQQKRPDSDTSPPRRRRDSDTSPPRRRRDSDTSPPRKRHDSNVSSKRKRRSSDSSPPRKSRRNTLLEADFSPSSKAHQSPRRHSDDAIDGRDQRNVDSSPPRKKRPENDSGKVERRERSIAEAKVLDGPECIKLRGSKHEAATAKALRNEVDARRKEIYAQWNSGVVQKRERERLIEDTLHEVSKPLARGVDDADRDEHLRAVIHADDPMLAFLRKKKQNQEGRPRYNGPDPPPNRFKIWPGYRWDGVDRSNGFEAKIIAINNDKAAREEHAYKWSTEDM